MCIRDRCGAETWNMTETDKRKIMNVETDTLRLYRISRLESETSGLGQ